MLEGVMPSPPIYLASNNPHKLAELQVLAGSDRLPVLLLSPRELGGMPDVAEDTGTFEGNSLKKARALRPMAPASCGVLSDDSGLCVDALGGRPGVDSAYFAGKPGNPNANLELLVERMKTIAPPQRSAHFVCVLVYIDPVGGEHLFQGRCDGTLLGAPEGSGGFGYDPLFAPEGHKVSFASLPMGIKNSISARGRAWHKFSDWLIATYVDSHS